MQRFLRPGLTATCLIAVLSISGLSAYIGAAFSGRSISQVFAQAKPAEAPDAEYQVGSILWTQTSGEYRALTYQAFHWARVLFDQDLKANRRKKVKRPAIVVDADETVIDNSKYQATLVKNHTAFTAASFTDWCQRGEAGAIPGALDFLKYAASRGARVFYITNRRSADKACTAANLKSLGFPDVSDDTLLVRPDAGSSSKEPRRQLVAQTYRIVLLIGDNLNDLSSAFERKPVEERLAAVDQMKDQFGSRFIVIPNAMYGDWESAIYGYSNLSEEDKAARRTSWLKTY